MSDSRPLLVYYQLHKEYNLQSSTEEFLHFENPYQILIATILSAQTTDKCVNKVTKELFSRYPTPDALASADLSVIEHIIHSTGFFRAKAKNIIKTARMLSLVFQGIVPCDFEQLQKFPGVGRKTANIVMQHAFGINQGIAVDTHVKRLSLRIGLTKHRDPLHIEHDLTTIFPDTIWGEINSLFILHGRKICKARSPFCLQCCIRELCDYCITNKK